MCKVITQSDQDFVTTVTICNNRQNPVAPWNLRANDMIQLRLATRFREELGLFYERQENAFEHFSDEELQEKGLQPGEAVELVRLAQTFLVTDGSIDKLSRMNEVFENDKSYEQVFAPSRLTADFRAICLCYKLQFKLRLLVRSIVEKGLNKYAYMPRARPLLWALMCQAMLNHPDFDHYAEEYGSDLRHPRPRSARKPCREETGEDRQCRPQGRLEMGRNPSQFRLRGMVTLPAPLSRTFSPAARSADGDGLSHGRSRGVFAARRARRRAAGAVRRDQRTHRRAERRPQRRMVARNAGLGRSDRRPRP